MELRPAPWAYGTQGTPIGLVCVQGRKAIRTRIHAKLVDDGCKTEVPENWRAQMQKLGVEERKLRFIEAETHRFKCSLCDAYPDNLFGVMGHIGGKKHIKREGKVIKEYFGADGGE